MIHYALVRHPPVTGGAGRCYGRLDLPLAEPETAIPRLVTALAPMRGAMIHTSPLARCRLVTEALAADWGMPAPIPDPRLVEMDFGNWEGQAWDDVPRDALERWAADLWGFSPPGGETGGALVARVTDFWRALNATTGAHVIITHGGPLKVLQALAEGKRLICSALPLRPAPCYSAIHWCNETVRHGGAPTLRVLMIFARFEGV